MVQLDLFKSGEIKCPSITKRDRRLRSLNLDLIKGIEYTEKGMPIVKPTYHTTRPQYWQLFTQATNRKTRNLNAGVMCFQDDYKIDRIWNNPQKFCGILKRFPLVASPDYSLYSDMPIELQRYNVYRNRFVAAYLQTHDVNIVLTISWSTEESYDFCFDGVYGGTVIISTVGVLNDSESRRLWCNGTEEMVYRVKPDHIMIYGRPINFDFHNIDITYIDYIHQKGGVNYGR